MKGKRHVQEIPIIIPIPGVDVHDGGGVRMAMVVVALSMLTAQERIEVNVGAARPTLGEQLADLLSALCNSII